MSLSSAAQGVLLPRVVVRRVDDVHVFGTWGTTLIQIWRGPPSGKLSAEVNRIAGEFITSHPGDVSSLFIVERSSPPPDDETRKNFAAFSRDLSAKMNISIVVAEGGGFRGALVRAVGVTLTTLLPHSAKFKFVNDLNVAARLVEPHLRVGDSQTLLAACEELRAKILSPARS